MFRQRRQDDESSKRLKKLEWVGSSRKDLKKLPEEVCDAFGSALLDAQYGDCPRTAHAFGEGLPPEIMKLVEDDDGNTYRAAYTVEFPEVVYVLDVFQKKSKSGKATPRPDKARVLVRYHAARMHYRDNYR
jgi:phage-related protein